MYCESQMTVYNRHTDHSTDTVTFHRSVLRCHWEEQVGKATNSDSKDTKTADIFIPLTAATKTYLEPEEYANLSASEADNYFTFSPEDPVFHSAVTDSIPANGLKDFLRSHVGSFRVLYASYENYGSVSMRHWEVHCSN